MLNQGYHQQLFVFDSNTAHCAEQQPTSRTDESTILLLTNDEDIKPWQKPQRRLFLCTWLLVPRIPSCNSCKQHQITSAPRYLML
jgi:hypothetical protein